MSRILCLSARSEFVMSTTSGAPAANASTSSSIPHDIIKQYVPLSRVALNDDQIKHFPALPRLYAIVFLAWLNDGLIHLPSSLGLYSIGHYMVLLPSKFV
jgi:hypothetical protein